MKKSFLGHEGPWLTGIMTVDADTPEKVIGQIEKGLREGADSFCLEITRIRPEFWNVKDIKRIFEACGEAPVYACCYRTGFGETLTDEEISELIFLSLECGATLLDVMGDIFHPEPWELTYDEAAVEKQKALIQEIHARGGEVLMSSHNHAYYPKEKTLEWALAQKERGADVAKIIGVANTEEELLENLKAYPLLNEKLGIPYLFMTGGDWCMLTRECTGRLGGFMYLGKLGEEGVQPEIATLKYMRDEMILK